MRKPPARCADGPLIQAVLMSDFMVEASDFSRGEFRH